MLGGKKIALSIAGLLALASSSFGSSFSDLDRTVEYNFNIHKHLQVIIDNATPEKRRLGNRGFSQLPGSVQYAREIKRQKYLDKSSLARMCYLEGKDLSSEFFTEKEIARYNRKLSIS